MTEAPLMTLDKIEDLACRALRAAGTSEANARPLAKATAATEADGIASHGLAYIPTYCEHVRCGKVDGQATPVPTRPAPSVIAWGHWSKKYAISPASASLEMAADPRAGRKGVSVNPTTLEKIEASLSSS